MTLLVAFMSQIRRFQCVTMKTLQIWNVSRCALKGEPPNGVGSCRYFPDDNQYPVLLLVLGGAQATVV